MGCSVGAVCDTLVSITPDGVLFAKNSDRDPNEAQTPRWYEAADHGLRPGDVDCTWISIPQVEHTHAVLLSQPWWMWGAEMGANEHGVVIGNEAVFTNQPLGGRPARDGPVAARRERAATADDAVGVIVELLERHGQGGPCSHEKPGFSYHNSFLVADPSGAIVLETAGANWAVEQVTGRGRSISNGLSIPGFAEHFTSTTAARSTSCAARRARTQPAAESAVGVADLFAGPRPRRWAGAAMVADRRCDGSAVRPRGRLRVVVAEHGLVGERSPQRSAALGDRHVGAVHLDVPSRPRGSARRSRDHLRSRSDESPRRCPAVGGRTSRSIVSCSATTRSRWVRSQPSVTRSSVRGSTCRPPAPMRSPSRRRRNPGGSPTSWPPTTPMSDRRGCVNCGVELDEAAGLPASPNR